MQVLPRIAILNNGAAKQNVLDHPLSVNEESSLVQI